MDEVPPCKRRNVQREGGVQSTKDKILLYKFSHSIGSSIKYVPSNFVILDLPFPHVRVDTLSAYTTSPLVQEY